MASYLDKTGLQHLIGKLDDRYISASGVGTDLIHDNSVTINKLSDDVVAVLDNVVSGQLDEDVWSYGVRINTTVSSPKLERIGSSILHRTLPVQSGMKGCLLDNQGNVVKYLDPNDWSGDTDGSQGHVMVEIPEHYRKFTTNGNVQEVRISLKELPGFHKVSKFYVSAYHAMFNGTHLISACTDDYIGGNGNTSLDLVGYPKTSLSRTKFRLYARAINNGDTRWNIYTYDAYKTIYWLFVTEYATLNSQTSLTNIRDTNGYMQGGLDKGVTTLTGANAMWWEDVWKYNPIVKCGVESDWIGNGTDVTDSALPGDGDGSVTLMKYRGIENPFGHIWNILDGIDVIVESGDTGLSKVYVCSNPESFTDADDLEGYTYAGNTARSSGYIKSIQFGENGDIFPVIVGGSSSTYFCDYCYPSIPASGNSHRIFLAGGTALSGGAAGLACLYSTDGPAYSFAYSGSRLTFIPNN